MGGGNIWQEIIRTPGHAGKKMQRAISPAEEEKLLRFYSRKIQACLATQEATLHGQRIIFFHT